MPPEADRAVVGDSEVNVSAPSLELEGFSPALSGCNAAGSRGHMGCGHGVTPLGQGLSQPHHSLESSPDPVLLGTLRMLRKRECRGSRICVISGGLVAEVSGRFCGSLQKRLCWGPTFLGRAVIALGVAKKPHPFVGSSDTGCPALPSCSLPNLSLRGEMQLLSKLVSTLPLRKKAYPEIGPVVVESFSG